MPGFDGWVKTREFASRVTINALGAARPGARRTRSRPASAGSWCLGDSFTEAVQVAEQETPSAGWKRRSTRAAPETAYEVLNAGVGGWGTGQQLVYLREEGYRYQPDLVVVMLYLGNDIFDNSYALQGSPKNPHEPYCLPRRRHRSSRSSSAPASPRTSARSWRALRERTLLWNVFETGVLVKLDEGEDDEELRANRFNLNKMIDPRGRSRATARRTPGARP